MWRSILWSTASSLHFAPNRFRIFYQKSLRPCLYFFANLFVGEIVTECVQNRCLLLCRNLKIVAYPTVWYSESSLINATEISHRGSLYFNWNCALFSATENSRNFLRSLTLGEVPGSILSSFHLLCLHLLVFPLLLLTCRIDAIDVKNLAVSSNQGNGQVFVHPNWFMSIMKEQYWTMMIYCS